jgi:RNA recognition motif-containing protein
MSGSKHNGYNKENNYSNDHNKDKEKKSHSENFNNLSSCDSNEEEIEEMEIQEFFTNKETDLDLDLDLNLIKSLDIDDEKNNNIIDKDIDIDIENNSIIQDPANGFDLNSIQFSKQMKDLEDNLKQSKIEENLEVEKHLEKNYVFLKNIGENTTVDEIQEFFQRCGEIKKISLMMNYLYSGDQK